jgi:hypothetical protein
MRNQALVLLAGGLAVAPGSQQPSFDVETSVVTVDVSSWTRPDSPSGGSHERTSASSRTGSRSP